MTEWQGNGPSLHAAAEDAAKDLPAGPYKIVSIHVEVHHNQPGEQGPNPIREYSVVLGPGG